MDRRARVASRLETMVEQTPPTTIKVPIQFSLRQVFLGLLGICVLLGVFTWIGFCPTVFLTGLIFWFAGIRAGGLLARNLAAGALCTVILTLAGLVLFEIESSRRHQPQPLHPAIERVRRSAEAN